MYLFVLGFPILQILQWSKFLQSTFFHGQITNRFVINLIKGLKSDYHETQEINTSYRTVKQRFSAELFNISLTFYFSFVKVFMTSTLTLQNVLWPWL